MIPCTKSNPAILPTIASCFFRFQTISQKEAERIIPKTATANPFIKEIIFINFSSVLFSLLSLCPIYLSFSSFFTKKTFFIPQKKTPVHLHRRIILKHFYIYFTISHSFLTLKYFYLSLIFSFPKQLQ